MGGDIESTAGAPLEAAMDGMAERVAGFDWSGTSIGPMDQWPQSLKTVVAVCLNCRIPMFIWWGPELINIYNDAYAPMLGKRHPDALGQPARRVWAEIWPQIADDVRGVIERGVPVVKQRVLFLIERNGYPEEAYFTYSHSPVFLEDGRIGGLIQVCTDETARVLAEREVDRQAAQRQRAEERARTILESITDAFFAVDREWRFTHVNRQAESLLGRTRGDLLGCVMWDVFPGLHGSEFERMHRRAMDEHVGGVVTSFYPDHERWYEVHTYPTQDGISIYFRDVSEQARAEQARKELAVQVERQARLLDTALTHINDFTYTFDRDGRFKFANKPLLDLWGLTLEQAIGKNFFDLQYPHDLATKLQRQIQEVIATGNPVVDETPYTSPKGAPGYYEYIFTPVLAPDGSVDMVAGSTRDITTRKQLALEREQLVSALENQRARLAAVIEQAPAFMCTLYGPEHIFDLVNERYYDIIGRRDIIGKTVREALPEVEGQGFFELLDNVYRTGETFAGNEMPALLMRDGDDSLEQRYLNLVYQAMRDADGSVNGIFVHGIDVTDLVRSRKAILEREANFRQLADSMPQIVWAAQPDGVLDYYNGRWFEYIGLPADAVGDARWDLYIHPDDLPRAYDAWATSVRTAEKYVIEFRVRGAEGNYRWFLVRALPIRGSRNNVMRWFGTCTDIQDQRELAAQKESLLESERSARSEAERQSRMKDEFLATLSHELRTPLTSILGWAQIIKQHAATSPDLAQGIDVIQRNARAQAQIIEDLLDMSRIISGKVRLDVQQLDLSSIVQAAVETARPTAETKGVRLSSVIDPLNGVVVSGDANRLQQVFWNLLANAIKFTPRGGRVQVVLERINSHLEISVIDTGSGIKPEFLPHVFDRFRQADGSTTRQHGGLGLGLSIVRQLVELHGGTVHARSAGVGHGATFVVALPLINVHPEPEPAAERRHPYATAANFEMTNHCAELAGARVLVVDDEPDARDLLRRLLEDCNAVVAVAGSAPDALKLFHLQKFDVIISDVGMPGEDGYTLIKRIRAISKDHGGDVPAIALTAYARAEDRVRAIAAGFQMHLAKPVEPVELVTMVAAAFSWSGRAKT